MGIPRAFIGLTRHYSADEIRRYPEIDEGIFCKENNSGRVATDLRVPTLAAFLVAPRPFDQSRE